MGNNVNYDQYAKFRERQSQLAGMLNESAGIIADLNMTQFGSNLEKLSEKVHNDTFKIQIVGTFKNGKSTFINSILGEEILPAYALPCTAVINEVKWGEKKRAILHFCDPLPDHLPSGIPERALAHMKRHGMKKIPPIEIPYDEIEDYAVIPFDKDPKEMLLESPYEKIELFWPLELLKNGVEIIDSPGLNEHTTRTKVTMDYLSKADAILFVLNAQAICAANEMEFIENNLKEQGFTDPFFIVNRFDCIKSDREKAAMRKYVAAKLDGYTTNEIFYVSALLALEGKTDNDPEKYNSSGMKEFETRLSDYLTRQKGKAKLSQPARELKRILNDEALFKVIPRQRQMLSSSLDDIKTRYEDAKPRLAELKLKKDQLYNRMMLRVERAKPDIKRAVHKCYMEIADSVPVWVEEIEPATKPGLIPSKEKIAAIIGEISSVLSDNIEAYNNQWRKNVLEPLVKEKADSIIENAETDLSKIFDEIDSVNLELSGTADEVKKVPVWQRVVGVVGGLALGDIGMAFSGGVNGLSLELAKTAAFEVGAGFVLGLLGIFNPFTLAAVVVGAIVYNIGKGSSKAMKTIKDKVSEQVVDQIAGSAEDRANEITNSIISKFTDLAGQVTSAVDIEITETENQVKLIIEEMERGKENIEAKEVAISKSEEEIKAVSGRLDELIFQLVEE